MSSSTSSKVVLPAAGIPPLGQTSDFDAPNPYILVYVVLLGFFVGISAIALILRLLTHHHLTKRLVVEDYVIVLAWAFYLSAFVLGTAVTREGVGKHMWDVTINNLSDVLKTLNYLSITYTVSIWLTKTAILLQYLSIFASDGVNRPLRISCWMLIVINSLFYFVELFLLGMQCSPREKIWNLTYSGGHCLDVGNIWFGAGVFTTVTDVAILILPQPAIARLRMPVRKRLFIMSIFAAGSVACVAAAVRTYYTWHAFHAPNVDITYELGIVGVWIWIEMFIGILVFCLPTIPQSYFFLRSIVLKMRGAMVGRGWSIHGSVEKADSGTFSYHNNGSASVPAPLPYPDVSLASFELKQTKQIVKTNIHVLRSVSQVSEQVEERDLRRLHHSPWFDGDSDQVEDRSPPRDGR